MKNMRLVLFSGLVGAAFAAEAGAAKDAGKCATTFDDVADVGTADAKFSGGDNVEDGWNTMYDYEAWAAKAGQEICAKGKHQTPIDLPAFDTVKIPDGATADESLTVNYKSTFAKGDLVFTNTGNGVKINAKEGILGTATYGDDTYQALQYHIHFPSEHTVDGQFYPAELHIDQRQGRDFGNGHLWRRY